MLKACVVAACLTALVVSVSSPVASASTRPPAMVRKINSVRHAHGLPPLSYSRTLALTATRYAGQLMRAGRFAHPARLPGRARFARVGQALAIHWGWQARRAATIRKFLGSPVHRALILSRTFHFLGVGRARGTFHGRRATIWVVHLGRR